MNTMVILMQQTQNIMLWNRSEQRKLCKQVNIVILPLKIGQCYMRFFLYIFHANQKTHLNCAGVNYP